MTYAILSAASWPARRTSTGLSSPDHHALQVKLVSGAVIFEPNDIVSRVDEYRGRVSGVRAALQWATLAGALALLNASLTFENAWPTLSIQLTWALSIEVALCVLAIVVAVRWFNVPSPMALRILAAIWVVLVIGRYEDVTARSLYGRDINLYWDARNLPSVGAMLSAVAKPWLVAAAIAGVALVPLIIYLP